MSIRDRNIDTNAAIGKECIVLSIGTTATGQTAALADALTPGYPFRVVKVSSFTPTVTATISLDVQIAGTSALTAQITPTAATEVAGTLVTTPTGGSSDQLQLKYTSNGTGAATGRVFVWIKPSGMEHDPKAKG